MALVCRESSSMLSAQLSGGGWTTSIYFLMRGAVVSFLLYSLDTCACASAISCKHVRTLECKQESLIHLDAPRQTYFPTAGA